MRLIQLKLFKFGKENDAFQVTVQIAQYNYCNHGNSYLHVLIIKKKLLKYIPVPCMGSGIVCDSNSDCTATAV